MTGFTIYDALVVLVSLTAGTAAPLPAPVSLPPVVAAASSVVTTPLSQPPASTPPPVPVSPPRPASAPRQGAYAAHVTHAFCGYRSPCYAAGEQVWVTSTSPILVNGKPGWILTAGPATTLGQDVAPADAVALS